MFTKSQQGSFSINKFAGKLFKIHKMKACSALKYCLWKFQIPLFRIFYQLFFISMVLNWINQSSPPWCCHWRWKRCNLISIERDSNDLLNAAFLFIHARVSSKIKYFMLQSNLCRHFPKISLQMVSKVWIESTTFLFPECQLYLEVPIYISQ